MPLILHNAKIRTLSAQQPFAEAVMIHNGHVMAIGSNDEILSAAHAGDERLDMGGKTIWPGLTDAHIHLEYYADSLQQLDCETPSQEETLQKVRRKAAGIPSDTWIRGHGWNQNNWESQPSNAALLDQCAPQNPVYISSKSLHSGWANTRALQLAGINATSPDPQGGKIERDDCGNPTGILFESAVNLVEKVIPKPSLEELAEMIQQAQSSLWKLGLTGVHDFDHQRCFSALQILDQDKRLQLRVVKSIPLEALDSAIDIGIRSGFGSSNLRIGSLKCFADGALGPQTAAMLLPYEGKPTDTGILSLDSDHIFEIGMKASQHGISMAVHAIGDRANREALNGYARLRKFEQNNHLARLLHRIEHVQLLNPVDIPRLAELGITASVQPFHVASDMEIAQRYWGNRSENAYPFQVLLQQGTRLVFGSDAPVEIPNPFWGIHAAVTRQRKDGTPGQKGWYPQQRISLKHALDAYTIHPAFIVGWENKAGQIIAGAYADLIVLNQDPFETSPEELWRISAERTMIGGKWAYIA